jgi:hypothetical protein
LGKWNLSSLGKFHPDGTPDDMSAMISLFRISVL